MTMLDPFGFGRADSPAPRPRKRGVKPRKPRLVLPKRWGSYSADCLRRLALHPFKGFLGVEGDNPLPADADIRVQKRTRRQLADIVRYLSPPGSPEPDDATIFGGEGYRDVGGILVPGVGMGPARGSVGLCPTVRRVRQLTSRVCLRTRFCPWCWARKIGYPIYVCLSLALEERTAALDLHTTHDLVMGLKTPQEAVKLLKAASVLAMNHDGVLGYAMIRSCSPHEGGYMARRSLLVVTRAGSFPDMSKNTIIEPNRKVLRSLVSRPGPADLSRVVGQVAHYPSGIILGPPQGACAALEAVADSKIRHLARGGIFRANGGVSGKADD